MTVKQLIKLLEKEDPNRIVIIMRGGSFSPLSSLCTGSYLAETTWCGEVGLEKLTRADIEAGYTEEDVLKGKAALILVPTN